MPESGPRRIENLPEEERERLGELEWKTDEVYRLRLQLASFYRRYRKYLPTIDGKRLRVEDLARAKADGQFGDLLASPYRTADEEIDALGLPPKEERVRRILRRSELVGAFERAIQVHDKLYVIGGASERGEEHADERAIAAHYHMRWRELGGAMRTLDESRERIAEIEEALALARSTPELAIHPEDLRVLERNRQGEIDVIHELISASPEAYLGACARELREAKTALDTGGRIVETPYVKEKLARIRELIASGRPVFIHGELGSGKTELAKHLARTILSKAHLSRWEAAHPAPTDPADRQVWEAQRAAAAEALVVSGHKGLELDQLLAQRAIERREAPPAAEQTRAIAEEWASYRERALAEARAQNVSEDAVRDLARMLDEEQRPLFERAALYTFRAPVETKAVLAPVLQAMREGRPVIIDEINAIPHHVLIALNDPLMRKPGDLVTPPYPDMPPFPVQEGFTVIATGNYKPDAGTAGAGTPYLHRQGMDAAFLSRWGIVHYDYLPAAREIEAPGLVPEDQQQHRRSNELLRMIVARLLDEDLSATMPPNAVDHLERLAVVARTLQDVFSGKDVARAFYARVGVAEVRPQEVLKENVLSLRHLVPIVDRWRREGYRRPLDDYLFAEYLSRSDARPEEKLYLYRVLKVQGDFFRDADGWPRIDDREKILNLPIDTIMHRANTATGSTGSSPLFQELRTFSPKEVIERLYGPALKRTEISAEYLEELRRATPESEDAALERERLLERLKRDAEWLAARGFDVGVGGAPPSESAAA